MWTVRTLRQIELIGGLLLLLLLFTACSATAERQSETDRVVDDATIQAKVKTQLLDDPRIDAGSIELEVRRGIVTLLGWAESENQRKAIEDLAWQVDGVKQVENRLQLRGAGGFSN
jgi:osmotically-inducible protein OsmY